MPSAQVYPLHTSTQTLQLLKSAGFLPEDCPADKPIEIPVGLPAEMFADPVGRKYPCHTKMACFISHVNRWLDLNRQPEDPNSAIAQRLNKFADFWGISGDIERSRRLWQTADRLSQPIPYRRHYLRTESTAEDSTVQRYAIDNEEDCLKAAEWLLRYRDELEPDDSRNMCERLLTLMETEFPAALARLSSETLEGLRKQAGRGVPDIPAVSAQLYARARRLDRLQEYCDFAEPLRQLAKQAAAQTDLASDFWEQVRDLMHEVDRRCGLVSCYGQGLQRPEDVLHALNPQAAEDFLKSAISLSNGWIYGHEILDALTPEDVLALGGEKTLAEMRGDAGLLTFDTVKVAEFLAGLSPAEADFLYERLQRRNVQPVWYVPPEEPKLESWDSWVKRSQSSAEACCS